VSLLRAWLIGTALLCAALAVWAFAPVLVFFGLLALALGVLSAVMIWFAGVLKRWRDQHPR
jgi:hypothetical protein